MYSPQSSVAGCLSLVQASLIFPLLILRHKSHSLLLFSALFPGSRSSVVPRNDYQPERLSTQVLFPFVHLR